MGAKTWMLVYADTDARAALRARPPLDTAATQALLGTLFPQETLVASGEGDLSWTCPPEDEILAGCFPGVAVIAAKAFGIDYPSRLAAHFVEASRGKRLYLHAMHSVVDWFAYACWHDGRLLRALSLSPDSGILENIGEPLAFEAAYWAGGHPAFDDGETEAYPLPFHPLDLGDAALRALFGYRLEGPAEPTLIEPETVPLLRFKRPRRRWHLWPW